MRLEWDPAKSQANRAKHGVSFEEASELFTSGRDYLELFDEAHSDTEERFVAIGPVSLGLIVVVFTEPQDDVIRIVSARQATRGERRRFEARWRGNHE